MAQQHENGDIPLLAVPFGHAGEPVHLTLVETLRCPRGRRHAFDQVGPELRDAAVPLRPREELSQRRQAAIDRGRSTVFDRDEASLIVADIGGRRDLGREEFPLVSVYQRAKQARSDW
jgi:hypothetical protein